MKTYDDLLISLVREKMDGMTVSYGEYNGGYLGGVPDFFYDSSLDAFTLLRKRQKRSTTQKRDDDLSPEEYEYNVLSLYGLMDDDRNRLYYKNIRRKIVKADDKFNYFLKRFRYCVNEKERDLVISSIIAEIEDCLRRGSACPSDCFFLRRFGVYA